MLLVMTLAVRGRIQIIHALKDNW